MGERMALRAKQALGRRWPWAAGPLASDLQGSCAALPLQLFPRGHAQLSQAST